MKKLVVNEDLCIGCGACCAIDGCSFVNCSAGTGGAICSIEGLITVDGCSFVNCSATDEDGSHGGAICSDSEFFHHNLGASPSKKVKLSIWSAHR